VSIVFWQKGTGKQGDFLFAVGKPVIAELIPLSFCLRPIEAVSLRIWCAMLAIIVRR
jgi:hypothetical protein